MKSGTRALAVKSAPWLILMMIASYVLTQRLELSFDLSAFFPRHSTFAHEVLLEQLKNGPGSRLLVIGLAGADREQLSEASNNLREALASSENFVNVLNGESMSDSMQIPEPIRSNYLLLDDIDYGPVALERALEQRLKDLSFGSGSELQNLIARDPFLATFNVLQRLAPVSLAGEMWFSADGSAVLMAETRAPALDLAAQADAVRIVRSAFADLSGLPGELRLELTGVGAFGLELQEVIRAEAKSRTILASCALVLVLLLFYRRFRLLLLVALPLGMGFLVGLALLTLIFDTIHGITLAFGFTLLGITIDYPLHLISHSRHGAGAIDRIWPTMRLGAASTAIAYLALAYSGSDGLAQLGIFSACGIIVAVIATRYWLPQLLSAEVVGRPAPTALISAPRLAYIPAIVALAAASLFASLSLSGGMWDDRISSLSPVPQARLQSDIRLRSAASTPDMRYQLVLSAPDLETLLQENEALDRSLGKMVDEGLLGAWQSAAQGLPSKRLQQIRMDAIPAADVLARDVSTAVSKTPFQPNTFQPFISNALTTRNGPFLSPGEFEESPLKSWLDAHLLHLDDQWVSLISLNAVQMPQLADWIESNHPNVDLVDLQQSSESLMRDYRNGALKTISVAAILIISLLMFAHYRTGQILWTALTVAASLALTVAVITAVHGQLTIIHLVALLLVLGLGLDYALFLTRAEDSAERKASHYAVLACVVSTTVTFGILGGSDIPVLKFLGLTVAIGSAISFVLAYSGSAVQSFRFN
jgi:predicted exporter